MIDQSTLHTAASVALPLLLAITLHEAAHAFAAYKCGDNTAKDLGRLSLNPIKHIDPIGTILIPLMLLISGEGFLFGWAKPVPVNMYKLHKPRRDMALVAIAGPLSNLLMLLIWAVIFYKIPSDPKIIDIKSFVHQMAYWGILINTVLMVLNILPIPPLDGSRVVSSALPQKFAVQYDKIAPYGLFIVFALIFTGVLHLILTHSLDFITHILNNLFVPKG